MYKVIVVGTDGSDRAGIAVRKAMALAKVSGAELHAVNVVHAAGTVGFADSREGQDRVNLMREEAEAIRTRLLSDAEAEFEYLVNWCKSRYRNRFCRACGTCCGGHFILFILL